jgi:hypothetical protein
MRCDELFAVRIESEREGHELISVRLIEEHSLFRLWFSAHQDMQRKRYLVRMSSAPGNDGAQFHFIIRQCADLNQFGFYLFRLSHETSASHARAASLQPEIDLDGRQHRHRLAIARAWIEMPLLYGFNGFQVEPRIEASHHADVVRHAIDAHR